jgi:hypothetical protein
MVSGFPITIKLTPWLDMMYVKRPANFMFSNATSLAGKPIPLTNDSTLSQPVRAAPAFMSTEPRRAILSARISRFPLPLKPTFSIAENVFSYPAREPVDKLVTIPTMVLCALNKLVVVLPAYRMVFAILLVAFSRAKGEIKPTIPRKLTAGRLAAVCTNLVHRSIPCLVSTRRRTIPLLGMVARWHKQIAAFSARLFSTLRPILISARNRTKQNNPVGTFLNWLSTS